MASADGDEVLFGELGDGAVDGAGGCVIQRDEFAVGGQWAAGGVGAVGDGVAEIGGDLVVGPGWLELWLVAGLWGQAYGDALTQ